MRFILETEQAILRPIPETNFSGFGCILWDGCPLGRPYRGSRGLMDRVLDLKHEVTQGCGIESRLWQEVSTTAVSPLSKAPNPQLLPGRCNVGLSLLLHLDGLNAENIFHSSLYSVYDK